MGTVIGKRLAVVGAGWSGLCAAVEAIKAGQQVTLFEASQHLGGRARTVVHSLPDGQAVRLDNGQHILSGAYRQTLALLGMLGLQQKELFYETPLSLVDPDGEGITFPDWPSPLDAVIGVVRASAWTWSERWSLVRTLLRWQRAGFQCEAHVTVSALCCDLAPRVFQTLIEPLCVSALNTPASAASGQVFLRVLQDSLMGPRGSSHLLLPTRDLGGLFPQKAADWLEARGVGIHMGCRVKDLHRTNTGWELEGRPFDQVILACAASHAYQLLQANTPHLSEADRSQLDPWLRKTQALKFEAIATVYAWAPEARLSQPMLALRSSSEHWPAQFVFDRGRLGGPEGLLAFVVSASRGSRQDLQRLVLHQAQVQLGLTLSPVLTVVEKQATFACTPGLIRPSPQILSGLVACGDYVAGPYPATIEGAVRSARHAVSLLTTKDR